MPSQSNETETDELYDEPKRAPKKKGKGKRQRSAGNPSQPAKKIKKEEETTEASAASVPEEESRQKQPKNRKTLEEREKLYREALADAKKEFEDRRDAILAKVPKKYKDMFGQIGFTKWTSDYIPVLILNPYSVPEKPVREQWIKMLENLQKSGRLNNISYLVYFYGATNLSMCYGFIAQNRFISYESGVAKKYDELPKGIRKKIDSGTALTAPETEKVNAFEEMREDLELEPVDRKRGIVDFKEGYQELQLEEVDEFLPMDDDEDDPAEEFVMPKDDEETEIPMNDEVLSVVKDGKKTKKMKKGKKSVQKEDEDDDDVGPSVDSMEAAKIPAALKDKKKLKKEKNARLKSTEKITKDDSSAEDEDEPVVKAPLALKKKESKNSKLKDEDLRNSSAHLNNPPELEQEWKIARKQRPLPSEDELGEAEISNVGNGEAPLPRKKKRDRVAANESGAVDDDTIAAATKKARPRGDTVKSEENTVPDEEELDVEQSFKKGKRESGRKKNHAEPSSDGTRSGIRGSKASIDQDQREGEDMGSPIGEDDGEIMDREKGKKTKRKSDTKLSNKNAPIAAKKKVSRKKKEAVISTQEEEEILDESIPVARKPKKGKRSTDVNSFASEADPAVKKRKSLESYDSKVEDLDNINDCDAQEQPALQKPLAEEGLDIGGIPRKKKKNDPPASLRDVEKVVEDENTDGNSDGGQAEGADCQSTLNVTDEVLKGTGDTLSASDSDEEEEFDGLGVSSEDENDDDYEVAPKPRTRRSTRTQAPSQPIETKKERKSKAKKQKIVKPKKKVLSEEERLEQLQKEFEINEDTFYPLLTEWGSSLKANDAKKVQDLLEQASAQVGGLTTLFIEQYDIPHLIKRSKVLLKENNMDMVLFQAVKNQIRDVHNQKKGEVPKDFKAKKRFESPWQESEISQNDVNDKDGGNEDHNVSDAQAASEKKTQDTSIDESKRDIKSISPARPQPTKAERKKFSLGSFMRPSTKEAVSTTDGVSAGRSSATVKKSKLPLWVSGPTKLVVPTHATRSFALEFLQQAAGHFPPGKINADAFSLTVEAAIYGWSKEKKGNWEEAYWEKIHAIVAAVVGMRGPGTLMHLIMEGDIQEAKDFVLLPQSKLIESFEGKPVFL